MGDSIRSADDALKARVQLHDMPMGYRMMAYRMLAELDRAPFDPSRKAGCELDIIEMVHDWFEADLAELEEEPF